MYVLYSQRFISVSKDLPRFVRILQAFARSCKDLPGFVWICEDL